MTARTSQAPSAPTTPPAPHGPRRLALRDRSIRTKIMVFAVVGFALLAVSDFVGVTRMAHVSGTMLTLVENEIPAALVAGDLRTALGGHHQLTDQLILATTADGVAEVERAIAETEKAVDAGMDAIIERASDPNDASEAEEARGLWQAQKAYFHDRIEPTARRTDLSYREVLAVHALVMTDYKKLSDETESALDALQAEKVEDMDAAATAKAALAGRDVLVGLFVVGGRVLLVVGIWLARLMSRPIAQVEHALDALADGDLTAAVEVDSRDEVGRMAQALSRAQDVLRDSMTTIMSSSSTLAGSAEELSAVSAQVAASAEETSVQSAG